MTGNLETLEPGFGTSSFADFPPATEQEPSALAEGGGGSESRSEKRWGWGASALIEGRGERSNGGIDRRRSDRLAVAVPVRLEGVENGNGLEGAELVNMADLSLGGATLETVERHSRMISEDIERFLRGERPRRLVNPEALTHVP